MFVIFLSFSILFRRVWRVSTTVFLPYCNILAFIAFPGALIFFISFSATFIYDLHISGCSLRSLSYFGVVLWFLPVVPFSFDIVLCKIVVWYDYFALLWQKLSILVTHVLMIFQADIVPLPFGRVYLALWKHPWNSVIMYILVIIININKLNEFFFLNLSWYIVEELFANNFEKFTETKSFW